MVKLEKENVQKRLQRLAEKDSSRRVFGSAAHNYVLNPPLDGRLVEVFEEKHGIQLPEDYRHFITEIGNGGAGPAYGLFPFGFADEGRSWESLPIGDLSQPFPYKDSWNLDEPFWRNEPVISEGTTREEEVRLREEWDKLIYEQYWNPAIMNGAIPICDLGCGLSQWLVINGEQRGYIWDDRRAEHGGLAPLIDENGKQMAFTDWYLRWLEKIERGEGRLPVPTVSRPATASVPIWRDVLTLFILVMVILLLRFLFSIPR